jgi:hypothetical protein
MGSAAGLGCPQEMGAVSRLISPGCSDAGF